MGGWSPLARMQPVRRSVAAARLRRRSLATRPLVRHSLTTRAPTRSGGATIAAVLGALGLIVALLATGVLGTAAVVTVASINVLSEDLPDPSGLATLEFDQPTIVYDRTGKTELARFQQSKRTVVDYRDVPPLVLDATTTAEDRTFWENDGFDVTAMVAAAVETVQGNGRGASTITQQLVRARLLPADVVDPAADIYLRKAKEVIQSARVTAAFPGQTGKQQIITAYLNQIFYGHDAYGIAAAAQVYFGVKDLAKLTPAQAALLAALPQSPSTLDPYRYAVENKDGKLQVPADAPPVVRRDWILENLSTSRWTKLSPQELRDAVDEPVILHGEKPVIWRAPHFTWQVRRQLEEILGSAAKVETGGYRVITTLDWRAQQLAERTVTAAVIAPNLRRSRAERLLGQLKIPRADRRWIRALRGKDLHNAALVALDYRTGDVRAYVGSGGYYRDGMANRRFNPKYDAAGVGTRQPGSAFKPIVYATAFERRTLTPGSLLLDITTEFAPAARWAPKDADRLERGPVLVRDALQMSLNIPAIRALERTGNDAVAKQATKLGLRFAGGEKAFRQAGLAGAIGTVEVRPLDLTSAFGTIANGGVRMPPRMILEIRDASGTTVWKAPDAPGKRAISRDIGVPHHRHPPGEQRPARERDLGREAGAAQRARRRSTTRGGEDRHLERRPGPRDLRLPGGAPGRQGSRLGRRRVDGQQRPLDATRPDARDLAHGRRAPLAVVRPAADQGRPGRPLPRAEGPRDRADRRVVGRQAGVVDPRDDP